MFNEKLIKLRKENALTQEELAEKLGVTRQTISKWELGQTVPDKDKLVEMARVFNVTVDELLNEKKEEQTMDNNNTSASDDKRKKIIIGVGIGLGILLLIWIGYFLLFGKIFNSALNIIGGTSEEGKNLVNKFMEEGANIGDGIIQNVEKQDNNYKYENSYSGIKSLTIVKSAINEVIANNMKNENKITVKYNDITAITSEELASLVSTLKSNQYLITYGYNDNGYINQMNLSDFEESKTEEENKVEETIKKMEEMKEENIKQQEEIQNQIDSVRQKINAGL